MRNIEWRKLLPTKDFVYSFVSGLILLGLTLIIGSYWIPYNLARFDHENSLRQNLIENRNQFIKEFTQTGQKRIFLAERFVQNLKNHESKQVIENSWDDYMGAVVDWNSRNLLNPIFISYYFDSNLQKEYYDTLLKKNLDLHNNLLIIRAGKNINIDSSVEEAKHELFIFSEKLISY